MAFTTTQLQALEDAIASGELTVTYEGKTVTYRSIDDLRKAHGMVKAVLEAAGTITATPRHTYAAFSRD